MEKIIIYYIIVIIGIFLSACSQILLKRSTYSKYNSIFKSIFNWKVILAYFIFFITLLMNIYAMKNGVMLKDLPILEALGYVFVPILSYIFLKERITARLTASIICIIIGVSIFFL